MLSFNGNRVVAVGEAMVEMAVLSDDTYRRSFAGDTFNTAWHMSQIPGLTLDVGFVSKVGVDTISDHFVDMLRADGIDTNHVDRDPNRIMGLYMIELTEAERSFTYWRDASAARLLAEDIGKLDQAFARAGLIHVSGITLGILTKEARTRLFDALRTARQAGARLSFDPNFRPRLWQSPNEARGAMEAFLTISDIALPSFDDEAALWGDATPDDTIDRMRALGVAEVIVKNGAHAVHVNAGESQTVPPIQAHEVRDTSGAGDAFNAGYLAARISGSSPRSAVRCGQEMAVEVIRQFGARIPKSQVPALPI